MSKNNIPKVIHYCWFGGAPKNQKILDCIASWKKYCPDYKIIEHNEDSFDLESHSYALKFYKKKKWAFVSDYVRMYVLYYEGGIYLDTDVEIIKNFDPLLNTQFFTGFQDIFSIGCSVMGSQKNNPLLKEFLEYYNQKKHRIILPNLMNKIFKRHGLMGYFDHPIVGDGFTVFPKEYFYPYAYFENKTDMRITSNTYSIHYFDASWLPGWISRYIFPIIGRYAQWRRKKRIFGGENKS